MGLMSTVTVQSQQLALEHLVWSPAVIPDPTVVPITVWAFWS